jgi:hypothetical protein
MHTGAAQPVAEKIQAPAYLRRIREAPMSHIEKRALLEQAVRLLGRTNVASRLGVPETMLGAWMRGETPMPIGNLLIIAAMLEQPPKAAETSRQAL